MSFEMMPFQGDTKTDYVYHHQPTQAAFRGGYRLGLQCQQVQRDLCGETLQQMADNGERLWFSMLSKLGAKSFSARTHCLPYRIFVQARGMSFTAFFTVKDFRTWLAAYGITKPFGRCGWLVPSTSDHYQPLRVKEEKKTHAKTRTTT